MRPDAPKADLRAWLARLLLSLVLAVLLARLLGFAYRFARESVQMDLASFYTAGRAVDQGLSPYQNLVQREPPIWDGVASFAHSRFLYPPLAARAFQPLARLPYAAVKLGWTALSLAALATALGLATHMAGLGGAVPRLAVAALAAWFLPTLVLLERGQLDGLILLAIVGAVLLLRHERDAWAAGGLLALATLFKPHVVFFLPFLALRRRVRALAGFAIGGSLLVLLTIVLDGYPALERYALHEAPRIATHGEGGTREMALPGEVFRPLLSGVEPGRTVVDGQTYLPSYFRFVLNASLVQTRWVRASGIAPAAVSLALLGLLVVGVFCAERRWDIAHDASGTADLCHWWIVTIAILAISPVSWAMGAVWLLPLAPLVLRDVSRPASLAQATALACCAAGLVLAGAPDPYAFPLLSPFGQHSLDLKYIAAELCCIAGAFGLWRAAARTSRCGEN